MSREPRLPWPERIALALTLAVIIAWLTALFWGPK